MKIAVIGPSQMPARRANTIQTAKMCQAIALIGHDVLLLIPQPGKSARKLNSVSKKQEWEDFSNHYGLRVPFQLERMYGWSSLRGYDFALRSVLRARQWGAGLVFTRLPQAASIASLLAVPVIYEVHDFPSSRAARTHLRLFRAGRGARRLVAISQALASDLSKEFSLETKHKRLIVPSPNLSASDGAEHSFLIIAPDGVDLERYSVQLSPGQARQQLRERGLALPECYTAGYTGHLYAGRGVEVILGMAALHPQVNFLLVGGETADINRVQGLTQQGGILNITLTGFIPNRDLPLYQAACDVLLMPYQRNVAGSSGGNIAPYLSPMKLFEYLACGRPILSSNLPVLREILTDRNAILLPPEDVASWAQAMSDLSDDPEWAKSLSKAARQTVALHTWNERASRILAGIVN